jgi:hypothetical protein
VPGLRLHVFDAGLIECSDYALFAAQREIRLSPGYYE